MNNKSVFNVIIKNNFDEVAGKIDYLIQELNTVEKIRLDLSALNLNSLYLNNHDYAWNIFKGITPQHSIADDDFLYQQGDIDIQQLLDGQQNLIQQIMAYRELAASEFMAAHAYIPFAGAGIASGFIAQMMASVATVAATPFADGGIVYGPTLALTGEYPGAANNPEIIAPLSKLQKIIAGAGHYVEVVGDDRKIKAVIRGQDIELALANTTRIHRRKSNIRI